MKKNYQLDFIKLIFAVMIFMGHTPDFYRQDTVFPVSKHAIEHFGGIGVHVFFVISGLLMTNSIMSKTFDPAMSGKYALGYVLGKGKGVFLPCFTAATISAATFITLKHRAAEAYSYIPAYFLELFFVRGTGITAPTMFNSVTWYISAMLIAMLPLCYLLIRNKDFYLHVAAPLIGFLLMGYIYQAGNEHMPLGRDMLYGVVLGGVIRALCGLSMGSVSWLVCQGIKHAALNKKKKLLLTAGEIAGFALFFGTMFSNKAYDLNRKESIYFMFILMGFLIAVVFSKESYVSRLFKSPVFSHCRALSFVIYLNHLNARFVTKIFWGDSSYLKCVIVMALVTVINSLVYLSCLKLLRFLQKKLRIALDN